MAKSTFKQGRGGPVQSRHPIVHIPRPTVEVKRPGGKV